MLTLSPSLQVATYVIASHTNGSVRYIVPTAILTIEPMLVPMKRSWHKFRCCLGAITSLITAITYGLKREARRRVFIVVWRLVAPEGPTALKERLEWRKTSYYHS